jgi:chemotaxis protein methyltransferase CheR
MTYAPTVSKAARLVEGEFLFTEEDFHRIAAMAYEDAGIALPIAKATLVYSRLAKRLRVLRLTEFAEYCDLVAAPTGASERRTMLAGLTTNVTRFFREPHHFDHLRDKLLPGLIAKARSGGRVRIWSCACSSGQEPYSLAMTLLAAMPDAAKYDVRILASDIDGNVVRQAREGVYSEHLLEGIPADFRRRYTSGAGESVAMKPDLAELIAFRELNLIGDWPMRGLFDAIFCRNVAIYFDDATQSRLWDRLADRMAPGGVLYIGHSERVAGPAADTLNLEGITTYRKPGGRA